MISGKKSAYVLKVKGNSMIEDGIFDGDYVVVEHQDTADDGDIVIALLENGFATMKKFYKEATQIRLMPANASMQPIYATNVRIQGKVVGLVRKFN
jgi:repressor LexA